MRPEAVVARAALLAVLALATAFPVAAQSSLEEVERLTRMGRTEEARATLSDWWEGDRASASRRELQRGLWLRGRLTVDPIQAELDFQRLAVLYPSGQFTPDAILRLAQASWAMGDGASARRHVETLERDYPGSDALDRARGWMADAGPLPPPGDAARRSAVGEEARPDEQTPPDEAPESDPEAEEGASDVPMNYSVQLGAFGERERARALYDSVRGEGVDVRIVRVEGSPFTHVRVGRFAERSAAVELLEELTAMGINAALVRDERPEEPVGNR